MSKSTVLAREWKQEFLVALRSGNLPAFRLKWRSLSRLRLLRARDLRGCWATITELYCTQEKGGVLVELTGMWEGEPQTIEDLYERYNGPGRTSDAILNELGDATHRLAQHFREIHLSEFVESTERIAELFRELGGALKREPSWPPSQPDAASLRVIGEVTES